MSRYPVEAMRCAGLPNGYDDDDEGPFAERLYDDDGLPRVVPLGAGLYLSPHGIRTCRCGAQVLLRTRADAGHRKSCGEPADDDGQPG